MKMTDAVEIDMLLNSPELTNCLDFSSKLVSSGKEFKFFVKIGDSFVFNLSSKESGTSSSTNEKRKKKLSPSTKRRNAARLHEFLEKKNTFQCNQCKLKDISGK